MNPQLDYESARRLWRMFFPHMTEGCGVALVQELVELHFRGK